MLKVLSYVFGFFFLIIGILGFFPYFTPAGMFLGIFHVNTILNVIYIVTGAAGLLAGCKCCPFSKCLANWTPQLFFQVLGIVYIVFAGLGFWYGNLPILSLIASNLADTVFHLIVGLVSLYLGFGYKE